MSAQLAPPLAALPGAILGGEREVPGILPLLREVVAADFAMDGGAVSAEMSGDGGDRHLGVQQAEDRAAFVEIELLIDLRHKGAPVCASRCKTYRVALRVGNHPGYIQLLDNVSYDELCMDFADIASRLSKATARRRSSELTASSSTPHALIHTPRFGNHYREEVGAKSYLAFCNTRGSANADERHGRITTSAVAEHGRDLRQGGVMFMAWPAKRESRSVLCGLLPAHAEA